MPRDARRSERGHGDYTAQLLTRLQAIITARNEFLTVFDELVPGFRAAGQRGKDAEAVERAVTEILQQVEARGLDTRAVRFAQWQATRASFPGDLPSFPLDRLPFSEAINLAIETARRLPLVSPEDGPTGPAKAKAA